MFNNSDATGEIKHWMDGEIVRTNGHRWCTQTRNVFKQTNPLSDRRSACSGGNGGRIRGIAVWLVWPFSWEQMCLHNFLPPYFEHRIGRHRIVWDGSSLMIPRRSSTGTWNWQCKKKHPIWHRIICYNPRHWCDKLGTHAEEIAWIRFLRWKIFKFKRWPSCQSVSRWLASGKSIRPYISSLA